MIDHFSMSTFFNFAIKDEYGKIAALGNQLGDLATLIEWEAFRPLVSDMYQPGKDGAGRPPCDPVLLIKLLFLQQLYGLSDPQLEREAYDRLSFRHFLGYPQKIPDYSTVWLFRERLIKAGKEEVIWQELQNQIDNKGLTINRGVIQDATFITADPGHAAADKPRGNEARTRRSRDGTWAKKGSKSYFGYKHHVLIDKEHQLIRRVETTTASVHDSKIDLSMEGETVYRDKGYFGVKPKASMDKTMHRAVRGHPLSLREIRRNKAISRTRSLVERPFAVMKTVCNAGHVRVTTCARVHVKCIFSDLVFNLKQLLTIHRQSL